MRCIWRAAGLGHLTIIDFDRVELSNLNRQILYTEADIGRNKAETARDRLLQLNSEINVEAVDTRVDEHNINDLLGATRSSSKAESPSRAVYSATTTASAQAHRWCTPAPSTVTVTA